MWLIAVASFCYAWAAPFWGMLADKIGRKPVLLTNAGFIALLVYPTFMTLTTGNVWLMGAALSLLMILISGATATFVTLINELFPTNVRFSGVATGYNVSNAIFGGTTPLVAGLFIYLFGGFGASYYLIILTILLFILLWNMPETKGVDFSKQHQAG
jgi:MHS family proline/betaine transporter-like MFS transporter